MERQALCRDK